ncbi:MAG: hypothetical protein WDZ33_02975, partial [Balneolaceae bacterium]
MKDTDVILQKFLDGELSGDEEREALHWIAESEEMRSMLRFERSLSVLQADRDTNLAPAANVPEGFTNGVMQAVAQLDDTKSAELARKTKEAPHDAVKENEENRILERLSRVFDRMIAPAQFTVRPALLALVVMIAAGGWWVWQPVGLVSPVSSVSEYSTDRTVYGDSESMMA